MDPFDMGSSIVNKYLKLLHPSILAASYNAVGICINACHIKKIDIAEARLGSIIARYVSYNLMSPIVK